MNRNTMSQTSSPRFTDRYQPGWYFRDQKPFLAVYLIPSTANMTELEVELAVVLGHLSVERIAGCRVVPLSELLKLVELRATG